MRACRRNTHTHTRARARWRRNRTGTIYLAVVPSLCPCSHLNSSRGSFPCIYRIVSSRRYSNDIQCFIFSKKCILLVGEAGCAQNTMCSYLKAAKRGKPDSVQRQRGSRVEMWNESSKYCTFFSTMNGQNLSVWINCKPDVFKYITNFRKFWL